MLLPQHPHCQHQLLLHPQGQLGLGLDHHAPQGLLQASVILVQLEMYLLLSPVAHGAVPFDGGPVEKELVGRLSNPVQGARQLTPSCSPPPH